MKVVLDDETKIRGAVGARPDFVIRSITTKSRDQRNVLQFVEGSEVPR